MGKGVLVGRIWIKVRELEDRLYLGYIGICSFIELRKDCIWLEGVVIFIRLGYLVGEGEFLLFLFEVKKIEWKN